MNDLIYLAAKNDTHIDGDGELGAGKVQKVNHVGMDIVPDDVPYHVEASRYNELHTNSRSQQFALHVEGLAISRQITQVNAP